MIRYLKRILLLPILLFIATAPEAGILDWSRLIIEYPPQVDISLLKGHKIRCGTVSGNYTMEFDLPLPKLVFLLKDNIKSTGTYYCIATGYFADGKLYKKASNEVQFFLDYRVPVQPNFI